MKRTKITELLSAREGREQVLVKGWVRTRRDAKDFSFLEINDGSCLANIQAIVDTSAQGYDGVKEIGTGASVAVQGALVASPGKGQAWEVKATAVELIGAADQETFPLQKKRHSDEFLRAIAHLRPRTNKFGAMFRIRSELALAIHRYFQERGFFYLHTPIITGSDCEGAGEMLRVTALDPGKPLGPEGVKNDFFGKDAFLTVSGQLSAEPFALALGDVYTFGPTFRAEPSDTARHAAEFWMVEPEMAFATLQDNMDLAEDILKYCIRAVIERRGSDLELFAKWVDTTLMATLERLVSEPFERIPYREAVEILRKAPRSFEYEAAFGKDIQTEHERYLAEEHFKKPVIVYDYPKDIKAFYMRQNDDGETVGAMDVLVPRIGEIVGGSAREERLYRLEARIAEMGLAAEHYQWYLDTRRFGTAPHAGFGLGFERLVMLATGATNIRDVIAFPRTYKHLEF
ncbi:Asparagine--tRNA ligase [Fundidesulfovibrio magnetotacticus]|uniref:Asparagine--tRNA ligase n=1 Tax=Fundidesulfovibrio magnetotacticus TaxID=2730080 RepID=A0A6V8M192_9BACT|nr:asparagine--tRNA ligase [Fundidesulfovibrio magnetotacticus]GFK94225.1 Asparagine--tRNA ligase [Fundidesulfovibrio magnetotacticus]